MKLPADVRLLLQRRFANQHRGWLSGMNAGANWPLEINLGVPTEAQAMRQPDAVRAWAAEWLAWRGPGELAWVERQWRALGAQRLPASLRLEGPNDVAASVGQRERWARAQQRSAAIAQRWPALRPVLGKLFDVFADYPDEDYQRLTDTVGWLHSNPRSGLYVRQLPVSGLDSKWIEPRRSVFAELVAALGGRQAEGLDFYELCGLKRPPHQIRIRILDPVLRAAIGGLGDVTAPVNELAQLNLRARHVLVIENLQTGLALADLPGAVAIMGLGYAVHMLTALPWLGDARCWYWGDIDTHGFAILNSARGVLPHIESLLMDEQTLLRHRALWSVEPMQAGTSELTALSGAEADLYGKLKDNQFGQNIRLEQERIDWVLAWQVIIEAVGIARSC